MKIEPLYRILSGFLSSSKHNANADRIEAALQNTLSRDGTAPNAMGADIDMGGNRIVNVGTPADPNDAVRLRDIADITSGDLTVSADWNDLVNVPNKFPPEAHTHTTSEITDFTEASQDVIGTSVKAGSNISVSYNDTTGETTISASGTLGTDWTDVTNKPSTFTPSPHTHVVADLLDTEYYLYPNFVKDFGGVGDGATSNDTALANAEANTASRFVWMPEGKYKTTKTQAQLWDLEKIYIGPGKLLCVDGYRAQPNLHVYKRVTPIANTAPTYTNGTGSYGLTEDTSLSDVKITVIPNGSRKNFDRYLQSSSNPNGFPTYFWAPATPHYDRLYIEPNGGWSGFSGATSTEIVAGISTAAGIVGGTVGWNVGDEVGFTSAMDGNVVETRVLTGVDTSSGIISWSGPLSNTYPIGSAITHGYRTMNVTHFTRVEHYGHGDAYGWMARMHNATPLLDSQTSFEHGGTVGIIGGEVTFGANGCYATGWEGIYQDLGYDVAMIARVESYVRTNSTSGRNAVWLHDYAKMDGGGAHFLDYGLRRIDGVYVAAVGARTGLDFTSSRFNVAAIALPLQQKVAFDANKDGASSLNGNGFVATGTGNMYISGETDAGGKFLYMRGGGLAGIVVRATDVIEMIAQNGLGIYANVNVDGSLATTQSLSVAPNKPLNLNGKGGNVYFIYDSSANSISLYKNGVLVGSW